MTEEQLVGGIIILSLLAYPIISVLKQQRELDEDCNSLLESFDKIEDLSLEEAKDELHGVKKLIKSIKRYLNSWTFLPDPKKEHVREYLEGIKLYRERLELRIEELHQNKKGSK